MWPEAYLEGALSELIVWTVPEGMFAFIYIVVSFPQIHEIEKAK